MASTAVNYKTIESESYNNIYDIVDNRNNIADPRDPSNSKLREFVYDSDPLSKGLDFGDFPYIILEFPLIEQTNMTTDGKSKLVSWTQRIVIRSVRKGSSGGGNVSTGRTDLFSISDDLQETFNSTAIRKSLHLNGVRMVDLVKVSSNTDIIDQETIYENEYELRYSTRMVVSE